MPQLTQAHRVKFAFTLYGERQTSDAWCDPLLCVTLMLWHHWLVLLLLLDPILLWTFWVCSSWDRKPTSWEGKEAMEGEKNKDKKKRLQGSKKNNNFSLSQWLQQNVTLNILSWCWFVLFTEGLRKILSVHYSPILEMLLYHEYVLRGTKEKCFCAVVYDKQFLLHSTLADTPIMKIQCLGKLK